MAALDVPSGLHPLARTLPSGRSLALGFALIAVAVGLYFAARGTSVFAVHEVEVQGAPPRVAAQVQAALERPLEGASLLEVSQADIDRALAGVPDVQATGYDRAFPRTLHVAVFAERPVAVLRRGGDAWLVSERGRVLRELGPQRPAALPRIWVAHLAAPPEGRLLRSEDAFRPAIALGAVLAGDREFLARIREARLREGEIDLVLRNGVEVRLGPPHDVPLKAAVAQEVLAALPGANGGYLDVSVPERAVASVVQSQVSG
jgi:cell division protein FtsQ